MELPKSNDLPINLLAACFNKTSATYKFYWLLSILQTVENGNLKVSKHDLFSKMISNAWYTVNYFHISFGKQDLIQQAIEAINEIENIHVDEKQNIVFQKLSRSSNQQTLSILRHFDNNVPHWFLSPWFPKNSGETDSARKKRIYTESNQFQEKCLYSLDSDYIIINPKWKSYLVDNSGILKDFCYWNLALFLQSKNPNVPDIPNKLIKPARRGVLKKQRTQFWDIVIKELGSVKCIYTGKPLTLSNYAVEHFIPYNFVSHDLIWNLIPADISFNSKKSDKLPQLEKYFDSFYKLQKAAIRVIKDKSPNNKFLEDYLTIFPDLLLSLSKEKFRDRIQPLITIAANNGFEYLK